VKAAEIATAAVSLSLSQTETAKDSGQLPKIRPPRLAASSVPFTIVTIADEIEMRMQGVSAPANYSLR
jgi:hypothetical protein